MNPSFDCEKTIRGEELVNGSTTSVVINSPPWAIGMFARAVLTCRPNSHPFQDRAVSLDQSVKIGRSVARARPNTNNAIFDCKVLSRNHALLWYEPGNGKFFLQDTKSSNGTFVNNQRLSKSSEESVPREVCSGDIVQFGVDVMEVNKKVTHGCIVATLQLFLPDGKEAKASPSTVLSDKAAPMSVQEIYLLNQYIKDALQREQLIENKLAAINNLMTTTKDSVDSNWKTLIEEDRLLTRVDILERQLQTSHKTMTDDKLREEVVQLHDDKEKYQNVAKEALRKAVQEKMEALKKFYELEKNLTNSQEEKVLQKEICDQHCRELKELAEKYEQSEQKSKELGEEIDQSAIKYKEEVEGLNKRLKEGEELLQDKQKVIEAFITKVDSQVARNILAAHNEDITIINNSENRRPENESDFDLQNVMHNDRIDDVIKENVNRDRDELCDDKIGDASKYSISPENVLGGDEFLRRQLKIAESEKTEAQSRLNQLLNLVEDLKAMSNKVQVSEYLTELFGKFDIEIRQIKNYAQGEESRKVAVYNITNEVNSDEKLGNHINRRNSDDLNDIEKLLEESRQTVKTLQVDNVSIKRHSEDLQEKYSECAIQLDNFKLQFEALTEVNSELQSQIGYMRDKLASSERNNVEGILKWEEDREIIKKLKDELSALKNLLKEREQEVRKLNDLRMKTCSNEFGECALENVLKKNVLDQIDNGASAKNDNGEEEGERLTEKLLQTEAELAIFKDWYNKLSTENATLSGQLTELKERGAPAIHSINMKFLVPLAILILAVLIALHPSS